MDGGERNKIVSAVKALGRRVTAADVAAKTGMPLLAANRSLNAVASDCQATIQVTNEGNLVYSFAPLFDTAYLRHGFAAWLKAVFDKLFQLGYFLLRISFGVTLIASVITVAVLVVVAVISIFNKNSSSGGGSSNNSGSAFPVDLSFISGFSKFFVWNLAYQLPPMVDYGRPSYEADYQAYTSGKYIPKGQTEQKDDQGFILNCFSYLFGDGNPNARLEQRKWNMVAEHIRQRGGATTVEQLSCYTGLNPRKEDSALPVLVQFDGQPAVTDTGNIVYLFPAMQITAAPAAAETVPAFLEEKRWEFSEQPAESFLPVALFAFLNYAGCMWLLGHIKTVAELAKYATLIDWLSIYAAFFLFFPLIRYLFVFCINIGIEMRNNKRKSFVDLLKDLRPRTKIAEAQAYAIALNPQASNNVIYSTDKDLLDQQFDA